LIAVNYDASDDDYLLACVRRASPLVVVRHAADATRVTRTRDMSIKLHPGAALLAATIVLVADGVPVFDVGPHCHRIASEAEPVGDERACLQMEESARARVAEQWPHSSPADRSYCRQLTTLGGEPTFTELLTCLELQQEAKRLRERENGTTDAPPTSDRP
jgi:hypothetical protein